MNDSSDVKLNFPLHTASEEDLACRVQAGCADSFNELAVRLRPRLIFLLRRRVQHHDDIEDLTQKTLLRAYEKIHLYKPAHKFCTWVFTIAIRLTAEHYRKKNLPTSTSDQQVSSAVDPNLNPEQRAIQRENSQDLWDLAGRVLNKNQWTALWLLYGEGQTISEIGRTLGRTAVSVRVLLYRARKALIPHLEKFVEISENDVSETSLPRSPLLAKVES